MNTICRSRVPFLLAVLLVLFLGTSLGAGSLSAQEGKALSLLEEAGARYSRIQEFCADFVQTLEVPLLSDTTVSRGSLCQDKPNRFAMRFSDPAGDLLVADGQWFWVYYPSSDPRQVLQFDMEVRPGGVDFHREFLESPAEKYRMTYVGEEDLSGRPSHVIELDPVVPSGFERARIWLESERALILQARIGMENGSVRTVTLSDIQLDPSADPQRYAFEPPPGAQVIRRR